MTPDSEGRREAPEGAGHEAAARLAAVVECSDEAILALDREGTILTWNPAAHSIYGYPAAEVVGRPISCLAAPDAVDGLTAMVEALRQGEPVQRAEMAHCARNGRPIEVVFSVSAVRDDAGTMVGAMAVSRDVTEQRWLARTLDGTLSSLETALTETRESESHSRRFLADAAHQLRSPMAGIQACAESLLRGVDDEERERLLTILVRESTRAGRLMAGLLRMARLDQGVTLAPEPCDLVALCMDEADRVWTLDPGLDIVMRVNELPDPRPRLDAGAVREILSNLLDNARRHAARTIEVGVAPTSDGIEVRIRDDGAGVPDAMAEQIFERFVSLDDRGGSGLGLAIGRGLARAAGGDLTYEDRAFVLRLPVAEPPPAREPDGAVGGSGGA